MSSYYDLFLGPPLINYANHPRYPAIFSGRTQSALVGPPPGLALAAPASSTQSSNSNEQPPNNLNYATHPSSNALISVVEENLSESTQAPSTAPQSVSPAGVEEETLSESSQVSGVADEEEILSLADALNDLSTNMNDMMVSIAPTPSRLRVHNARYYSVVVGRCCGVYSSW